MNIRQFVRSFLISVTSFLLFFRFLLTCVCGWWSNMSIWISWVEVEGVLDILLFCTIDLTFGNLFSVSCAYDDGVDRLISFSFFSFFSREGEAADVSSLDGNIMATAASLQPIALQTGAPGFYTRVKTTGWRDDTSGYCFQNKILFFPFNFTPASSGIIINKALPCCPDLYLTIRIYYLYITING